MTSVKAAVRWTGLRFEVDEPPPWLVIALGSGAVSFNDANLAVDTPGGPVSAAPGDWVLLTDDGLASATDVDFQANYEIEGA